VTAIGLVEAGEIASLVHLVDAHGDRCGSRLLLGLRRQYRCLARASARAVGRIAVRQNQGEG